jgi:pimeloyl-ACP methyl ester carboxylesterase
MQLTTRLVAAGITGLLAAATIAAPGLAAAPRATAVIGTLAAASQPPGYPAPGADRTSSVERNRVDGIRTPKLGWYRCFGTAECATLRLPLDYDKPTGASTEIAVLRVRARNPQARIGSLFVNPGGPGGLGTEFAYAAPYFLGDQVLDSFDVIGFDPRGIGYSANVKCFRSAKDQKSAFTGLEAAFPYGPAQETAFLTSARAIGKGCSSTGKVLAGAMSTAEVARDMELLRRAVGDPLLSFLGFSYGTAIGQYYSAMFPDRVRAVVVDGVINPVSWAGTSRTRNVIQDDRLRSADGAYRALIEILRRCDAAGAAYCPFADGDPVAGFELVARRLRAAPITLVDPEFGELTVTYADFVGTMLAALYSPYAGDSVAGLAANFRAVVSGTAPLRTRTSLARRVTEARREIRRRDFPYDNGYETFSGVSCTDGLHPSTAAWPAQPAAADRRAPYFGRLWSWGTAQCARNTWTVRDEDAYRGPFNRRTSSPVLVVGSLWDPATNYAEAVSAAALLPNSRLLSSANWGHTAYGTSACVTAAVDAYLVRGTLPAEGTVCVGDVQPFRQPLATAAPVPDGAQPGRVPRSIKQLAARGRPTRGAPKQLPPVATRLPMASYGR